MMLLYFAWVRQKTGTSEERFTLPPEIRTVRDLAAHLAARGGGFAEAFGDETRLRVAVDQAHADWDTPIADADEVAFFPPVTGG
jgi:molybdopterin synthase sulfur carrier subunit